jgi:hypothetical protein
MYIRNILLALILGNCFFSCSSSGDLRISVKDSDEEYQFSAHFDEHKTSKVKRVIDQSIAPALISSQEDEVGVTTILENKTRFDLQYDPGDVLIKLNKNENSKASYIRIKKMCEQIKKVIGEK